jgi:hypothetical protein
MKLTPAVWLSDAHQKSPTSNKHQKAVVATDVTIIILSLDFMTHLVTANFDYATGGSFIETDRLSRTMYGLLTVQKQASFSRLASTTQFAIRQPLRIIETLPSVCSASS